MYICLIYPAYHQLHNHYMFLIKLNKGSSKKTLKNEKVCLVKLQNFQRIKLLPKFIPFTEN